jgi:pimeloyl-ACP methyl ester carboxylesterase
VPDLRKFVKAVLAYTGASRVDIVAHGMGVTLAREFARQDGGAARVRRFVAIEGPNRGMIICSAAEGNPWALGYAGGYTPNSPVCQELGSPNTPFLQQLNKSDRRIDPGSTLVIRNTDASCLFKLPDGLLCGPFGPTPAVDSYGSPTDFSLSARISGANDLGLSLQGQWDYIQGGSAHFGIANSSSAWKSAFKFLRN